MERIKSVVVTSAIGALPILALCVLTTLEIYAGNSDEFHASFASILQLYFPYLSLAIAVIGLPAAIMSAEGRRRYQALLAATAVLFWLQGNILVWRYGVLDGSEIDWLEDAWRGALDTAVWAVMLLAAIAAFRRVRKSFIMAAVAAFCIQATAAAFTASSAYDALVTEPDIEADVEAAAAIYRFSGTGNVVHIVMDGFQTDIFSDIVADPDNAGVLGDLDGFTLFADNTGVYPYTQLTVPAMLSGRVHRNGEPVAEFIDAALTGPTILSAAADHGYDVDIAAPVALKNVYARAPHTFAYGIGPSDHVTRDEYVLHDAAKLIDLALFRVVPHFAKSLVHRDELWVFQARVRQAAYLQMQYFSDLEFLRRMAGRMSVGRDAPVYKMLHLMLSHRPTVGNRHCEYDGRRATNRENVSDQARCGLAAVASVLRRMRELGIYDDSLIVLMADHGAWVPVADSRGTGDGRVTVSPMTIAMAVPLLAVKPPGASGALRISNVPTSVLDVPATIAHILEMDAAFPGIAAFAGDNPTDRVRTHLTYAYGSNPAAEGFLFPMQEYAISGSPFDAGAWRQVAEHPPGTPGRPEPAGEQLSE